MNSRGFLFCLLLFVFSGAVLESISQVVENPKAAQTAIPSVAQFGAHADGNGDNARIFEDAIRTLSADKNHGARIFIPPGQYHFSAPLHISRGVVLEGGSGAGRNSGTILVFDPGVAGIIIDRSTTSDDGGAGDWTVIRDLAVLSSAQTGNANGITMHARARLENVYVRGFGGNGVEIAAWARGKGPNTNANNWSLDNLFVEGNGGHGIHVIGADANAGVAIGVSAMGNGGWGFLDESFLGNTYVGCHTENNKKGGYAVTNRNARSIFIGSYTESGQPDNHIESPSMVIGGLFGSVEGSGFLAIDGHLSPNWTVRNQKDPKITTTLGFAGDVARGVLSFTPSDGSMPYRLEYEKSDAGWWDLNYGEAATGTALSISTAKSSAGAGQVRFPNGFFLGRGASARRFTTAFLPPKTVTQPGEVVLSADPNSSGYLGWTAVSHNGITRWIPFGALVRAATARIEAEPDSAHLQNISADRAAATPAGIVTFDIASGSVQKLLLHSDVKVSRLSNLAPGVHVDFIICQDAAGKHAFDWPANVLGGMRIPAEPNACGAQSFVFDGDHLFATSEGGRAYPSNSSGTR